VNHADPADGSIRTEAEGMNEEHPNAATYRKTADALRRRDFPAITAMLDEDVVWHVPGKHARAGDIRGRDAVLSWLADLIETGFWLREHDVFANDEHVCALSYMGARRPSGNAETRVVSIFHFRNGRQTERWFCPEDPAAWDRIFDGGA
jgi:uncharacterized protein